MPILRRLGRKTSHVEVPATNDCAAPDLCFGLSRFIREFDVVFRAPTKDNESPARANASEWIDHDEVDNFQ